MRTAEQRRDDDRARARLTGFIGAMVPIAIAFEVLYIVCALLLRSPAIAGGAAAVLVYLAALFQARRRIASGSTQQAAEWVGYGLLVMVAIGSAPLRFLFPALVTMPIAAVSVVLPFLEGRRLKVFLGIALAVEAIIVLFGEIVPPLFDQPPQWFRVGVIVTATLASCALTFRLLWADSERLRALLEVERRAVAARDEFLAIAGHELKTPLTTLQLRLARKDLLREAEIERLRRQVGRLSRLSEDLLDASRVASGRLDLERAQTSLAEIVQTAATDAAEVLERAHCDFTVEARATDVIGDWDRRRLEQVLTNLLSNAAKYGAGKPVTLEYGVEDARAFVEVRDRGIGLSESDRERIFERYERAVSMQHYSGFGLGLWIVREIVEAHGGEVSVRSAEGQGAVFRVELPL